MWFCTSSHFICMISCVLCWATATATATTHSCSQHINVNTHTIYLFDQSSSTPARVLKSQTKQKKRKVFEFFLVLLFCIKKEASIRQRNILVLKNVMEISTIFLSFISIARDFTAYVCVCVYFYRGIRYHISIPEKWSIFLFHSPCWFYILLYKLYILSRNKNNIKSKLCLHISNKIWIQYKI